MLTINEAIKNRHSVRSFSDEPLSAQERAVLQAEIERCNAEGNLHMSLVCDEPEAFNSAMAHYGKFSGCTDYLVIAGEPAADLEERAGYYGERVVLLAQQLGLGSCWVAMTFKKRFVKKSVAAGEKLAIVVALGHGTTQGAAHKGKTPDQVSQTVDGAPEWFARGVDYALMAPTAMNQQSFSINLTGGERAGKPLVSAKANGGFYCKIDLGIVKLHFELGAGAGAFAWA